MAQTPLQMLEIARAQSQAFINNLDRNIGLQLQTQQEASNAEVNLRLRGLEFAENQRMNDARIDDINNTNALRSQEFQLRAELAPLELQTKRLQLETQRLQTLNAKRETDLSFMNTITAPWDRSVSSNFAQHQDPSYMREYLNMKSQWMGRVSNGEQFNPDAYQRSVDQLNQQYAGASPADTKSWNPEVSYLLGLTDRSTQEQYNLRNPEVSASRNMLMGSYLDTKDTGDYWNRYGSLFRGNEDLVGKLDIARTTYQNNQSEISNLQRQLDVQRALMIDQRNPDVAANARQDYTNISNQIKKLQETNLNIRTSVNSGSLDLNSLLNPTVQSEQTTPIARLDSLPETPQSPVMGVEGGGESTTLRTRLQRVADLFTTEDARRNNPADPLAETELRNVNLSWFESNLKSEEPDDATKTRITNEIRDGIESTGINNRANENRVSKILESMDKEIAVPIDPWLARQLYDHLDSTTLSSVVRSKLNSDSFVHALVSGSEKYNPKGQYYINVGAQTDFTSEDFINTSHITASGIGTYKAFEQIINKIPNKANREEVRKSLYSVISSAAISSALSRR